MGGFVHEGITRSKFQVYLAAILFVGEKLHFLTFPKTTGTQHPDGITYLYHELIHLCKFCCQKMERTCSLSPSCILRLAIRLNPFLLTRYPLHQVPVPYRPNDKIKALYFFPPQFHTFLLPVCTEGFVLLVDYFSSFSPPSKANKTQ